MISSWAREGLTKARRLLHIPPYGLAVDRLGLAPLLRSNDVEGYGVTAEVACRIHIQKVCVEGRPCRQEM